MNIITDLIPKGKGVRTGKKLTRCLGLVVHWIGCCQSKAEKVRESFLSAALGTQYIIDWNDGHIIQAAPENEVCFHVGSETGYTALKKKLVGLNNPNWYFVGIECCIGDKSIPSDWATTGKYTDLGKPSDVQYDALVEFAADFLTRHGMTTDNLYRHYDITGKLCHVWFVKDAARWERLKADVAEKMKGESEMTEEIKALVRETVAKELAERDAAQAATAEKLSPWAAGDWAEAKRLGLMDGTRPGGGVTREQLAAVAVRICKSKGDTYRG